MDQLLVHFHRDAHRKGYQIVDFLLASGASIDAGDGCVMAAEASRGNLARLGDMMRRAPSPLTLENTLKKALSLLPGPVQRDIVRLILDSATTDIGQGDVALLAVQDEDTDLLKMVMNHGRGRVPFSCKEALWDAIDHDTDKAVAILFRMALLQKSPLLPSTISWQGLLLKLPRQSTLPPPFCRQGWTRGLKMLLCGRHSPLLRHQGHFPPS